MSRFDNNFGNNKDNFKLLHEENKITKQEKKKQINIRLTNDELNKLDYLCENINRVGSLSRSDVIQYLISKYDLESDSFNV